MIAHADQFKPTIANTNCAPFYFPSARTLRRLKLEIGVAVWNWEVRRGLPHYDGGFRGRIDRAFRVEKGEKAR